VVIELVESEGIENFEHIDKFIKDVKALGCKIAIDDFGTGYSNFEYLMKLNADYIKIDGAFIKNLDTNESSQIVVQLVVDFARRMGIKVIGEFVHNDAVYQKVKEFGIDYSQGYFLGEPVEIS
jgi:EAL domain-containing protein (putative c-di-GMP-specific phosphodiesterase class I)